LYYSSVFLSLALLVFGAVLPAQETMPVGILRGSLIEWQGGSLSVRQANGAVYDCFYDQHTLFQRNEWPIQSTDLNAGEPVEVLSDQLPGTHTCYVRMVSIVYTSPKPPRRTAPQGHAPVAGVWIPQGHLTYSGLVAKRESSKITLKTRAGPLTFLLRSNTRYTDAAAPLVNKHVYVRAGRNVQGQLEAYQVIWGEILTTP